MLINELPDDCLFAIFVYINELDDLVNCYKVCSKWSHLVAERTKKVKYLIELPDYSFDCVYYQSEKLVDGTCLSTLFPNLIIANFSYALLKKVSIEDVIALIRNTSLKGLNLHFGINAKIMKYCDGLEMLSTNYIQSTLARKGSSVKQLHLWEYTLDRFKEDAHYFPNLERLHIYNDEDDPDRFYNGPVLEKLKIVELYLTSMEGTDTYYGFQFMDICPNLRSAHIHVSSKCLYVDDSLKHKNLQDLVLFLDFSGLFYILPFNKGFPINWDIQKQILDHTFRNKLELEGSYEDKVFLYTEPYFNFRQLRETMLEVLYEEYGFGTLAKSVPAFLSMVKHVQQVNSDKCCLVVDSGYSFTHVVPFIGGKIVKGAIRRMDIGGKAMTNHLKDIISYRQLHVLDETYVINQCNEDCCHIFY